MKTKCDLCSEPFDIFDPDTLLGTLDEVDECSPFTDLRALCAKCLREVRDES